LAPFGDIIGEMEVPMRATVALDDDLLLKAQELSGVTERTALLRMALKSLIHLEASRRLAAVGGTEPELQEIKRVRADNPSPKTNDEVLAERLAAASDPIEQHFLRQGATERAQKPTKPLNYWE
jgi:Arc/MetJ family transcription regulator